MEEPNEGVMSSIVRRDISWLWPHSIAFSHLTLVEGEKGVNKGTMLLNLAARLSLGMPMPCVQDGRNRTPVNSIFFCGEDPIRETFKARCEVSGGDSDRIFAYGPNFKIPRDWERMADIIQEHEARFVVFDPVATYLRSMYHGVREALEPVYKFALEKNVAFALSRHLLYKSLATTARARGVGSFDFVNLCRSALLLARHPQNADGRVLIHTASNLGPLNLAVGFSLQQASLTTINKKGLVAISKEKSIRIESWFQCDKNYKEHEVLKAKPISKLDQTIEWLRDFLRQPRPARDVKREANNMGFSLRYLDEAKSLLQVQSKRAPYDRPGPGSKSLWSLPGSMREEADL